MTDETYGDLCADLAAEQSALAAVLDGTLADFDTLTPADGWTIQDQIGHLAYFDDAARRAVVQPDAFNAEIQKILAGELDPIRESTGQTRALAASDVRAWWDRARSELIDAVRPLDAKVRLPWYGPPMSARSFVTARLMETWAHGQDVRDALDQPPEATGRLRHVAHLGYVTRGWSYQVHDREAPTAEVRVELAPPSGEGLWVWGPDDAPDRVTGPALDFCLVVTQRRHPDDTRLKAVGPAAVEWLQIAQAFAGGPGPGRPDP